MVSTLTVDLRGENTEGQANLDRVLQGFGHLLVLSAQGFVELVCQTNAKGLAPAVHDKERGHTITKAMVITYMLSNHLQVQYQRSPKQVFATNKQKKKT